jgi:Rrf2 family protein
MLTQKAKYAFQALLMLGEQPPGKPLLIADIAAAQDLPRKFLELILLELKHHGILHSRRGKHGGYALARDPSEITFGEVVRIIDGPIASVLCASQSAYRRCADCRDEANCAIRKVFRRVRDATSAILDNHTLADALRRGARNQRRLSTRPT